MTHINFIYMYCESHHLYLIAVETGNIPATNHVKFWFIIYHWTTEEPWNLDNSNSQLTQTEFPFPWTEIYPDNLNSLLTQTVFCFPSEFHSSTVHSISNHNWYCFVLLSWNLLKWPPHEMSRLCLSRLWKWCPSNIFSLPLTGNKMTSLLMQTLTVHAMVSVLPRWPWFKQAAKEKKTSQTHFLPI